MAPLSKATLDFLPKRVSDLPGMLLEVECLGPKCKHRLVRLYPTSHHLDGALTMAQVLARCRCTECRRRPDYLILTFEGRRDPQYLFMKDGTWLQAPPATPIDADWFWSTNAALKRGRKIRDERR